MGLLSWLGLKRGDEYPNLDALRRELRRALPAEEAVVLRYVSAVVVLLGKVACSDGRPTAEEEQTVRRLLSHVDRLAPSAIDAVCTSLLGAAPSVTDDELSVCFRDLRALCDRSERLVVLRLLASLAAADGALTPAERADLGTIAEGMGVPAEELESALAAATAAALSQGTGRLAS